MTSPSLPHGCSDQLGQEPASSPSYGTVWQAGGDGWQPIETAPMDGTAVVLAAYVVPSEVAAANGSRPIWSIGVGREIYSGFWSGVLTGRPSYWRPLLDPPDTAT